MTHPFDEVKKIRTQRESIEFQRKQEKQLEEGKRAASLEKFSQLATRYADLFNDVLEQFGAVAFGSSTIVKIKNGFLIGKIEEKHQVKNYEVIPFRVYRYTAEAILVPQKEHRMGRSGSYVIRIDGYENGDLPHFGIGTYERDGYDSDSEIYREVSSLPANFDRRDLETALVEMYK